MLKFAGASAPLGWLMADSKTIGNAASGATGLANNSALSIFTLLWNAMPNGVLPIQDSTGASTTRGSTAVADFNAGKRLPSPDLRGRIPVGADNMNGVAAGNIDPTINGVDGQTLGQSGGTLTVAITVPQMGQHTHSGNLPVNNIGTHAHGSTASDNGLGSGGFIGANQIPNGGGQLVATTDTFDENGNNTVHQHALATSAFGQGQAHANVMPTKTLNYIIRVL